MSKKAAKGQKEQLSYEYRDVVLAKVRGFPAWPGMIVDPASVPENVVRERPANKKTNWYCVRFFPAGDYAWLVAKDISKLQKHEIDAYIGEPFRKSGELLTGYQIALDPTKWEEELQAAALEAEEETADAEVDQLASEDEAKETESKSKKRKRDTDAPSAAKAKTKSKAKHGSDELAAKKSAKGKKPSSRSKAIVESEDDFDQDGPDVDFDESGPSRKASSRPKKKAKKEYEEIDPEILNDPEAKKVREWRHQLQKTFLSNKAKPKDDDMPAVDALFTNIEQYDKMSMPYLQFSKIGKVMRRITSLSSESLLRDDEFNFKKRASALVERWHEILSTNKVNGGPADGLTSKEEGEGPKVNGGSPEAAGMTEQTDTAPVAGPSQALEV